MRKVGLLTALAMTLVAAALPAKANTVEIGASINNGAIATLASGGGQAAVAGAVLGPFLLDASGVGNPPLTTPDLFDGNTIGVSSAGSANTLQVFVTQTGVTNGALTGTQELQSSFTQNLLTAGWTITATTFADNTNTAYGMQQLLNTTVFTSSDVTTDLFNTAILGSGLFSLTEEWSISAPSAGSTNNTTDITATPLPPTMQMFLGGLLMFGGFLWIRNRKQKLSGFAAA
jgi:hypothetical protein